MCFRPTQTLKFENKCPKCGTVNVQDATLCSNCGAELPKVTPAASVYAPIAGVTPPAAPDDAAPPKVPPSPPKAPPSPPKTPQAPTQPPPVAPEHDD